MNWYEIALGVVLIAVSLLIIVFTLAQEQKGQGLSAAIMGDNTAMAAGRPRSAASFSLSSRWSLAFSAHVCKAVYNAIKTGPLLRTLVV